MEGVFEGEDVKKKRKELERGIGTQLQHQVLFLFHQMAH